MTSRRLTIIVESGTGVRLAEGLASHFSLTPVARPVAQAPARRARHLMQGMLLL